MLNNSCKLEIIKTNDGSKTIYIPELNEHFHSFHGAINEGLHVFIKNGLNYFINKKSVEILEIGFGTGLNVILTLINSENKEIDYTSLDSYILDFDMLHQLNYSSLFDDKYSLLINEIQKSKWNVKNMILSNFFLSKVNCDVINFSFAENQYDIIYFDAFGPRVQPEMWNIEILKKLHFTLKQGGIFVTYCAKGQVKRDLKELGFELETLVGPPGKREMIRAIKI